MIIDAKAINVSNVSGLKQSLSNRNKGNQNNERYLEDDGRNKMFSFGYKLCICLMESKTIEKNEKDHLENKKLGLVFAIRNDLECFKFNSFCSSTSNSTNKQ